MHSSDLSDAAWVLPSSSISGTRFLSMALLSHNLKIFYLQDQAIQALNSKYQVLSSLIILSCPNNFWLRFLLIGTSMVNPPITSVPDSLLSTTCLRLSTGYTSIRLSMNWMTCSLAIRLLRPMCTLPSWPPFINTYTCDLETPKTLAACTGVYNIGTSTTIVTPLSIFFSHYWEKNPMGIFVCPPKSKSIYRAIQ